MEQIATRITEKLHKLDSEQLTEVETFVESLQTHTSVNDLSHLVTPLSEAAFAAVWNNPEDMAYDAL